MNDNVEKIEATTKLASLKRVAAYARVSSGKDAMLQSLSSQISYYSRLIQSNDDWTFVGVYSDEAISGTKDTREGFQRLIQDAKVGKIDLIITKAISRFARNTLTLLETTRELKKFNVNVYFEEERIYSMSNEGEMILSMLASVAQEQARSTSENMLWRIKKDMEQGVIWGSNDCLGYKLINRHYVIDPETAGIVKRIFHEYINGKGALKISKELNDECIKPFKSKVWGKSVIMQVINNINYTGDLLLQKTYRENYMTKLTKNNKGQKDRYYIENDHEAIITHAVFNEAQRIRKERAKKIIVKDNKKINKFSGLLYCGYCGKRYMKKENKYRVYWSCSTFQNLGKKVCNAKQIRNDILEATICEAIGINEFDEQKVRGYIQKIEIFSEERKLKLFLSDGTLKEVIYPERKRSSGWTEEMREVARKRTSEYHQRRKEECQK